MCSPEAKWVGWASHRLPCPRFAHSEGGRQRAWLRANPAAQLLIEGHTDERGDPAHNMVLGERRARATRDTLVARQVEPSRISIKA
jgi:hypothetical protein